MDILIGVNERRCRDGIGLRHMPRFEASQRRCASLERPVRSISGRDDWPTSQGDIGDCGLTQRRKHAVSKVEACECTRVGSKLVQAGFWAANQHDKQ